MKKIKIYKTLALIIFNILSNSNLITNINAVLPKLNNNLNSINQNYLNDKDLIFKGIKIEDPDKLDILSKIPKLYQNTIIDQLNSDYTGLGYLVNYLTPWKEIEPQKNLIELSFENVDLNQFVKYLSDLFKVNFITADNMDPVPENWTKLEGHKVTFKSHKALTEQQVWEIGLTFLDMAGFSVVPESTLERTYLIAPKSSSKGYSANKEPLPTFIGVQPESLPDNDSKIRYIYFIKNADLKSIAEILKQMTSVSAAQPIIFQDIKAVILTDTSSNIKSIMAIVTELDKVSKPEVLSVVYLNRADAANVADLINKELLPKVDNSQNFWGQPPRKEPTSSYFSKNLRVIAFPGANALIILGPEKSVKKLEDFIVKEIDQENPLPYAPLHIYKLKHLNAVNVQTMLKELIKFGDKTPAGESGGVRGDDQYFSSNVEIFSEPSRNSLIIKSNYEDYLKIKNMIDKLDIEQPQVAIKVLILNADLRDNKELGTQLRSKASECQSGFFNNISFQNSNLGRFIENPSVPGSRKLVSNLISLASGQSGGSTLISLGKDLCGVWGIVKILEEYSRISIVANPFLITTNKYPARIQIGEVRRIPDKIVQGNVTSQGYKNQDAYLTLEIKPTISYDDIVTLDVYVELSQFTQPTDPNSGNKRVRGVQTTALVSDKEVLALGGISRDTTEEVLRKMPILGDIPFLGTLFKFKRKIINKSNLLVLIAPQIIRPGENEESQYLTQSKINEAKKTILKGKDPLEFRDPIYRWYFKDYEDKESAQIDKFTSRQSRYSINNNNISSSSKVLSQKTNSNDSLLNFIEDQNIENEEVQA